MSDFSSDSESDDEEYLLSSAADEDREAMIRRKLLQSFYGTSDPAGTASANDGSAAAGGDGSYGIDSEEDDDGLGASSGKKRGHNENAPPKACTSIDLDATDFNASLYTSSLIQNSTTQELLTSTNNLSQSIRLLDSTMQTLVYENYSKFISATDAIRSIGQSVDLSNEGLDRLHSKMTLMEENTTILEESLAAKRHQVVEKLKLKRLLQRLTRLVELPSTLKDLQRRHLFRFLMRDYLDAMRILTQHSHNFESLKHIEEECSVIVQNMIKQVGYKMWLWCGGDFNSRRRRLLGASATGKRRTAGVLDRFWMEGAKLRFMFKEDDEASVTGSGSAPGETADVLPAKTINEIYECAGALLLYARQDIVKSCDDVVAESSSDDDQDDILAQLTEEECKAMALESVTVYLEGLLEDHAIDIQDQVNRIAVRNNQADEALEALSLYPDKFLNSLLEAATLYGVTFNPSAIDGDRIGGNHSYSTNNAEFMEEYITTWFTDFLAHIKNVLEQIEQTRLQGANDADEEEGDDEVFAAISNELSKLVRAVRETASGLALPEVGLDMEVASSFVEEAVGTIESMVRRRIAQKFNLLRVRVVKECISPFIKSIQEEEAMEESKDPTEDFVPSDDSVMIKTIQAANVALSDGMQFVDDTIRSILCSGSEGQMSNVSLDSEMVKLAVRNNAREFAFWLASCIETLAGSEVTSTNITLDVRPLMKDDDEDYVLAVKTAIEAAAVDKEDQCNINSKDPEDEIRVIRKDQNLIQELIEYIEENTTDASADMLNIALVEMCRLAERNVSNNINQSIISSIEDRKVKHDFFSHGKQEQDGIDSDNLVSTRFRLASSRSLAMYTRAKGYEAASSACYDLIESSSVRSEFFPHGPSDAAVKMLEVTKHVCIDCSAAFGGNTTASPIPDFENDYRQDMTLTGSLGNLSSMSGRGGAIKGLSLDVARMFTQKVKVYSHPLDMLNFSRDEVVSAVLRVACKAWIEQIRELTFTAFAYRQIQVDIEFLKYLLPHYVGEDSPEMESVQTVLSDVVLNAGERCMDADCVGISEYHDEAMGKVMTPLSIALSWLTEEEAAGGRGALDQFVIRQEEYKE